MKTKLQNGVAHVANKIITAAVPTLAAKRLVIKPNGIIKGGYLEYLAHTDTGEIEYDATVTAHYLFSDHTLKNHGSIKVDPQLFMSSKILTGQTYQRGDVSIVIKHVDKSSAIADVHVPGKGEGQVVLSVLKPTVEVTSITATITVLGMSINLEAR